jgi:hypothetical protein
MWEGPFSGTCWIVLAEYAAGNADVWFEPASGQNFHVKVWYSDGSTAEADTISSPAPTVPSVSPTVFNAFYLGVTGQDYVGTSDQPGANGHPDWHIRLQGLRAAPIRVRVTSDSGGMWEAPFSGLCWIVFTQYGATGNADVWFEPASGNRFHVKVWYSDGSTDEVDVQ